MSDSELLELYAIYYNAFVADIAIVLTMLFAYLVATYVAARKLGMLQFYGTALLFAMFTFSVAIGARNMCERAWSLQTEILRRVNEPGSDISYVSLAGVPEFLPNYLLAICGASIVLAVACAFSWRREESVN